MKIRPVILSGGSGTRLWPVSRLKSPKQFVPLMSEDSLFTTTLCSVGDAALYAPPMIVGNCEHEFLIHNALEAAQTRAAEVILEPVGRNTAAAALAAALMERDSDILHLVRPSDHIITDVEAWHAALAQAVPAAGSGSIVLFGIKPDHPETGYGYILCGENAGYASVNRIASFKEKPDAATAASLIASGALWNSGIFLYSPQTLIEEAEELAPDLLRQLRQAVEKAQVSERGKTLDKAAYAALPSEPFDRVIMERTSRGAVMPCSIGWNDVGSWQALWQAAKKDEKGNAASGPVVAIDTQNSFIRSDGPAVAVLGMDDVAVVATKDAVLITPRAKTQDVKKLVAAVEESNPTLAKDHTLSRRPWGAYESLASGPQYQVKHITVLPGGSLSLQMHHHRAEHWVVVEGTAEVQCGDVKTFIFPNESIYIPKGTKHRLSNPGIIALHLIEVQSGDYLGEDDIIRFEDDYGRLS